MPKTIYAENHFLLLNFIMFKLLLIARQGIIHSVIGNNLYIYIIHTDRSNIPSPSITHHQEKPREIVLLSAVHPL